MSEFICYNIQSSNSFQIDNLVNQKVLTRYLVRVGLDVEVASDGQECVDMFLSHPHGYYSIILCDLFMPVKGTYMPLFFKVTVINVLCVL